VLACRRASARAVGRGLVVANPRKRDLSWPARDPQTARSFLSSCQPGPPTAPGLNWSQEPAAAGHCRKPIWSWNTTSRGHGADACPFWLPGDWSLAPRDPFVYDLNLPRLRPSRLLREARERWLPKFLDGWSIAGGSREPQRYGSGWPPPRRRNHRSVQRMRGRSRPSTQLGHDPNLWKTRLLMQIPPLQSPAGAAGLRCCVERSAECSANRCSRSSGSCSDRLCRPCRCSACSGLCLGRASPLFLPVLGVGVRASASL